MTTETQGKTPNDSTNQPQNDTELLRIMTGYNQHASFSMQPDYCAERKASRIYNTLSKNGVPLRR